MTAVRVQHAQPAICIGAILVMKCLDATPCYCCFLIWTLSRILNQVNAQPEYWSRWILMEYYYAYASTQISSKPIYVVWSNGNIHLFYHEFHLTGFQIHHSFIYMCMCLCRVCVVAGSKFVASCTECLPLRNAQ